tara:strand:+ start:9781 stop:10593 length:813 start_codon:yes stop_codon:yes gene_type:complete
LEKLKEIAWQIKDFLGYGIYTSNEINIRIGTLLAIFLVLFLVTWLLRFVNRLVTSKLPEVDKNKFVSIFWFLKYLLYLLVVVTVLHASGVDFTVLLTASAALFVGLGFALQYLFQDVISGILIITDQSLHVGDVIEVNNKVGRVFEIRLRTTRAITRDDKVIIIPNHIFLTDSIYNYTHNHIATRESVKVGVAIGTDVELVTRLLEECATVQKGVLKQPPAFVIFDDFGSTSLIFILHFFIEDSFSDPKIKSEIRYRIHQRFAENRIDIS